MGGLVDLSIALGIILVWMWQDAKHRGVSILPHILLTLTLGSVGPLVYLIQRASSMAYALGRRLWQLAYPQQHPDFALSAHRLLGVILHYLGRPRLAQRHHARGVTLYEQHRPDSVDANWAQNPGVFCLGGHSVLLWYLGYAEQALTKANAAVKLAQGFPYPYNLALALSFGAEVYNLRRDGSLAQANADQMIALAREHVFPFWETQGLLFRVERLSSKATSRQALSSCKTGWRGWQPPAPGLIVPIFWLC